MIRLTMSHGICQMASTEYCSQHRDCYECGHGRKVFSRLATYEDMLFDADGNERIPLDRLTEICAAEKDGRLFIGGIDLANGTDWAGCPQAGR